jgi:hypothetical protein
MNPELVSLILAWMRLTRYEWVAIVQSLGVAVMLLQALSFIG